MPFLYLKKMWVNVSSHFLVWPELSVCLDGSSRDRHVSFVPVLGCEECLRNQEDPYLTESRGFGKVFKPSGQRLNCDQFMQQVGTSWCVAFIGVQWEPFHVIRRSLDVTIAFIMWKSFVCKFVLLMLNIFILVHKWFIWMVVIYAMYFIVFYVVYAFFTM